MRSLLLASCLGCASVERPTRVDILPLPPVAVPEDAEGGVCEPTGLAIVEADANGRLDRVTLEGDLASAKSFAERCCTGDEAGDATVTVSLAREGFGTTVAVQPDSMSQGATGACLRASFHRVTTKGYQGDEVHVTVRLRVP